jgi:hypothetical protein
MKIFVLQHFLFTASPFQLKSNPISLLFNSRLLEEFLFAFLISDVLMLFSIINHEGIIYQCVKKID